MPVAQEGDSHVGPCSTGVSRQVAAKEVQMVQNLIQKCLILYMSKKDIVQTLQTQAKVEPNFTTLVWSKLEDQNREFFAAYHLRQKLKEHIVMFNYLCEQQYNMLQKLHHSWLQAMPALMGPGAWGQPGMHCMGHMSMATSTHSALPDQEHAANGCENPQPCITPTQPACNSMQPQGVSCAGGPVGQPTTSNTGNNDPVCHGAETATPWTVHGVASALHNMCMHHPSPTAVTASGPGIAGSPDHSPCPSRANTSTGGLLLPLGAADLLGCDMLMAAREGEGGARAWGNTAQTSTHSGTLSPPASLSRGQPSDTDLLLMGHTTHGCAEAEDGEQSGQEQGPRLAGSQLQLTPLGLVHLSSAKDLLRDVDDCMEGDVIGLGGSLGAQYGSHLMLCDGFAFGAGCDQMMPGMEQDDGPGPSSLGQGQQGSWKPVALGQGASASRQQGGDENSDDGRQAHNFLASSGTDLEGQGEHDDSADNLLNLQDDSLVKPVSLSDMADLVMQ